MKINAILHPFEPVTKIARGSLRSGRDRFATQRADVNRGDFYAFGIFRATR